MSELPPGWVWTDTATVAEVQGGIQKQPKRRPTVNHYPFLRVANVLRGRLDLREVHEIELFDGELEKFRLCVGDLLVVEGNGSPDQIGRAAHWHGDIEDCVHQNHLIRVRPAAAIDSKYLTHYWNASRTTEYLRSIASSTSGLYVLTAAKVRGVRIPLPPLEEQRRIVAAVEEQFSRLDAGVAALGRVRQNLKRMRAAVLVDAFTHLEATLSATSGQELFPFVTSGSRGWAKYYSSDGPEFLRIGNVPRTGIDLDLAEIQRVSPPANAEGRRTRVQSGDLLISITADLGRVAVIPQTMGEAYINQHLALARPIDGAVPRYLAWYLASPFGLRQWDNLRRGATKIGLGLDDIRSLRIPIPTSDVQQSTVDVIEAAWEGFQWLEQSLDDCERRAQHLRSSLLAAAFSGRLVAQEPTDEPAAILLERIAAERASSNGHKPKRTRKPRLRREGVTA